MVLRTTMDANLYVQLNQCMLYMIHGNLTTKSMYLFMHSKLISGTVIGGVDWPFIESTRFQHDDGRNKMIVGA